MNETIANCLHEAMDLDGLKEILDRMGEGTLRTVAVDTPRAVAVLPRNSERQSVRVSRRCAAGRTPHARGADAADAVGLKTRRAWARWIRPRSRRWRKNPGRWCAMSDELHDALLTLILLPPVDEWRVVFRGACAAAGGRLS